MSNTVEELKPRVVGRKDAARMLAIGADAIAEYAKRYEDARERGIAEADIEGPYLKPQPRGEGKTAPYRFAVTEIDAHVARELAKV